MDQDNIQQNNCSQDNNVLSNTQDNKMDQNANEDVDKSINADLANESNKQQKDTKTVDEVKNEVKQDGKKEKKKKNRSSSKHSDDNHKKKKKEKKKKKSSRSRSHSQKKKDKKKKKHKHSRSKSNSSSSFSKSKSKEKKQKKRKKNYAEERQNIRNRRSKSPLQYFSKSLVSVVPEAKVENQPQQQQVEKPTLFWDGFQWVPRTNSNYMDPNILNQTRKMRKAQISNLPLELGLTNKDIFKFITDFMIKNYLTDNGNTSPIVSLEINEKEKSVILEFSSVEETSCLCKLEKLKIFNNDCRITRLGDTMYGGTMNLANLVSQAQQAAQAQAAALTAMNMLQNKIPGVLPIPGLNALQQQQQLQNIANQTQSKKILDKLNTVLKVTNIINPEKAMDYKDQDWYELEQDLIDEFSKYGIITHTFLVRPHQSAIGAEMGTLFIQYSLNTSADQAMQVMNNRIFDGNQIKVLILPEDSYSKNIKPLSTNQDPNQENFIQNTYIYEFCIFL